MKLPVFVDSRVRKTFELEIVRAFNEPNLWHPILYPMKRLFLFYGQSGLHIGDAIVEMSKEHQLSLCDLTVSHTNIEKMKWEIVERQEEKPFHILLIRRGELLKCLREAYSLINIEWALFIIVVSDQRPDDDHPFFQQFERQIASNVPSKDFHRTLLDFYLNGWKQHWTHSTVELSDEDVDQIANCCDFCTPKDVEEFCQRVFAYVVEKYPAERVTIDKDLLEQFMFESQGVAGIKCIVNRNTRVDQMKMDPLATDDVPTMQDNAPRKKRAKTDVVFE